MMNCESVAAEINGNRRGQKIKNFSNLGKFIEQNSYRTQIKQEKRLGEEVQKKDYQEKVSMQNTCQE